MRPGTALRRAARAAKRIFAMPERDLPQGTADQTSRTFEESIEDISEILHGPQASEEEDDIVSATDDRDASVAPDGLGSEDSVDGDVDGEPPDSEEIADADEADADPQVPPATDDARVTLDDGTETTVGELKRNTLFQRDYTRKTQELAEQRRTVEDQKAGLGDYAQALADERAYLISASQMILPQEPSPVLMEADPVGYMQAKAEFDQNMQVLNGLMQSQQAEQGVLSAQAQQMDNELRAAEAQKLVQSMPELNSRDAYEHYWTDAVEVMGQEYGFSAEELDGAVDHRLYKAMRDLVRYHRARSNTPSVSRDLGKSPKLMRGAKRMDHKSRNVRNKSARAEQLRKTGDFEAGISALMDLDL